MFDDANWNQTESTAYIDVWFSTLGVNQHLFGLGNTGNGGVYVTANKPSIYDGTNASIADNALTAMDNRYRIVGDYGTGDTKEIGGRDIDGAGSFDWDTTPTNYDGAFVDSGGGINLLNGLSAPTKIRDFKIYTTRKGKDWVEDNL